MRCITPLLGLPFLAQAVLATPIPTSAPPHPVEHAPEFLTPGLAELARDRGLQLGAAVAIDALDDDPNYRDLLAREFNTVVAENAMKFEFLQRKPGRFDFRRADRLVAFAAKHQMQIRGHTLVWHWALPDWLEDGDWSKEQLLSILEYHIKTVVGRYRGDIVAWDVVNEAIDTDGRLRDTIWLRGIGPEYIELAFRWAHEADPNAMLIYNDFGNAGLNAKSNAIYQFALSLLEKGVPIHGVGLQMHLSIENPPDPVAVTTNLQRLAELGLRVQITEMDVRIPEPVAEGDLITQARIYRNQLQVCLQAPNCDTFTLWGVSDRYSWVPQFFTGSGEALLFDAKYRPKPAYFELQEALRD